jgi:transaldolase
MRIFVHSVDTGVIQKALNSGFVYGITINPTILRRLNVSARQVPAIVQQAATWGAQEIHLQVYAGDTAEIVNEGKELAALDRKRVVVRIPATAEGYTSARVLTDQGVRVSMTAVYNLRQALLAHNVGAESATVFLRRMNDAGIDGLNQIAQMQRMLHAQQSTVTIMAASIREPVEVVEKLAMMGVEAATLSVAMLDELLESPATAQAVRTFREDAEAVLSMSAEIGGD